MFKLIYLDNTVSAQVQHRALLWLNYGTYHVGVVIPFTAIPNKSPNKMSFWEKRLFSIVPIVSIGINTCNREYDKRWAFYFCCFSFFFGIPLLENRLSLPRLQRGLFNV